MPRLRLQNAILSQRASSLECAEHARAVHGT
jgi:hypothetical protein